MLERTNHPMTKRKINGASKIAMAKPTPRSQPDFFTISQPARAPKQPTTIEMIAIGLMQFLLESSCNAPWGPALTFNILFLIEFFAGADEAGAVEDDDQRTDVVEHRGDNRIQQAKAGERQANDDEQSADAEILVNDRSRAA